MHEKKENIVYMRSRKLEKKNLNERKKREEKNENTLGKKNAYTSKIMEFV
jgi:hypothetical protein